LLATVLSVSTETGQVEVQAGRVKLTLSLDGIEKVTTSLKATGTAFTPITKELGKRSVSLELDLRGKRAEEVETLLDTYLNNASLASLGRVRIIHGFGTGAVRKIVRELLISHPLVKSFSPGERGEGGDGVTIVKL
jgi:DNA mismatch repair protein MutS2